MTKLQSLTNNSLKDLLRMYGLEASGNKAEMVLRLSEHLKRDEVPDSAVNKLAAKGSHVQAQFDAMKTMMEDLMRQVAEIARPVGNEQPVGIQDSVGNQRLVGVPSPVEIPIQAGINEAEVSEAQAIKTISRPETRAEEGRRYNINEIMAVLPEFNTKSGNISSNQFIEKIDSLRIVYGWAEETILYAVQGKLLGYAKLWIDAQDVFRTWNEFSNALIADFPCGCSMADEHLALAATRQDRNESAVDYYYRMLAKARRAKIDDKSMIRHII